MNATSLLEQIEEQLRPLLAERRFELIETQYRRESGQWVLRIFIDKLDDIPDAGGAKKGSRVTLDDCEKISEVVGSSLDSSNLLERSYVLEVSSPGINRPLKTESHFKSSIGKNVKVSLYASLTPESRQRNFSGVLMGCENQAVEVLDIVSGKIQIPISAIVKARLDLI